VNKNSEEASGNGQLLAEGKQFYASESIKSGLFKLLGSGLWSCSIKTWYFCTL